MIVNYNLLYGFILSIFLSLKLISSNIGVGFLTINTERGRLIKEDYRSIINYLNYASTTEKNAGILENLQAHEIKNDLKNLDFILISFQETDTSFNDTNYLQDLLDKSEWRCQPVIKQNGWPSIYSKRSTAIIVCNREKYKNFYPVEKINGGVSSVYTTKYIGGYCYTIEDADYCFLGGHFPVKIDGGAELLKEAIKEVQNKSQKKNFYAYVAGDVNTRALFKVDEDKKLLEKIITTDWKELSSDFNSIVNRNSKISFENLKMEIDSSSRFMEIFNNALKKEGKKLFIKFMGNQQLRQLPFTYKYKTGDSKNYDVEKILDARQLYDVDDKRKVYNLGWLDRLICVSSDRNPFCRIANDPYVSQHMHDGTSSFLQIPDGKNEMNDENRNIKYFHAPLLKKGDHMPILGFFEIEAEHPVRQVSSENKEEGLKFLNF
jgi:hypothetical protein